jgi:hypothetical protein
MPCQDITEILKLSVDSDNHVRSYSLIKRTCGGAVGREALLAPWLKPRTVHDVLTASVEDFYEKIPTRSKHWEYLYLKHFFAVRSGLEILTGEQAGGKDDCCAVESISYDADGTVELTAHLKIKALTDKIESCKGCCGSKKSVEPRAFSV